VGGFGISREDDLLFVEDIQMVNQFCSWAHVAFDDESVADFFDRQVDAGLQPEQFARIWIHTHPGDCPLPSGVDEETFDRVFGRADWSLMFILARGGESYARLRYDHGPKADFEIPVTVDYSQPFSASDQEAWGQEYERNVQNEEAVRYTIPHLASEFFPTDGLEQNDDWPAGWFDAPETGFLSEEIFDDEYE
jgi:hypothetical protein